MLTIKQFAYKNVIDMKKAQLFMIELVFDLKMTLNKSETVLSIVI